jgi:hypothetical protein
MQEIKQGIVWKILVIALAFVALYFEIDSYTNTKGSIGELMLYPNQDNALIVAYIWLALTGITLLLARNTIMKIVAIVLIILCVALFYPSFDMQGVDHAF